ncbi:putative set domain-containing protein 5 protein [Botrytis fragariae]|uniref:Putative set domain-containing protein 5 protein n=1 Tax=Botrytis fragariae TaxID=1964551 RepID=A0A8H6AXB4_9HELO|nr:putative set domain-containing protein 5 protein [Botrytis fragariae]KAF5875110.1 putative set domain-containing protein 5 protein [Botrytis fragariae]
MSSSVLEPMYAIQEVPGKGKGLVAIRTIPMGTCILAEEPIIRIPEDASDTAVLRASVRKQVEALTTNKRQAFLSMHNIYANDGTPPHLGTIRTNALPFGDSVRGSGIFINACRINHACDNNAQKGWNENTKRHTIYAKRDIESGEEITIFYLGILNKRETRQQRLRSEFAFTCSCHLCSLPLDQSKVVDRKLEEILKLDELISQDGMMGILSVPLLKLRYVDQQVRLYNELGPNDTGLPRAFYDAAQICIANGDLARARIFVEKAVRGWSVLWGEDSPSVLQYKALLQNLEKHELYGISKTWKMAVDEVPTGLEEEKWENWLWRRKKKTRKSKKPLVVALEESN